VAGGGEEGGDEACDDGADDAVVDGEFCDGGVCHALGEGEEGDVDGGFGVCGEFFAVVAFEGAADGEGIEGVFFEEPGDGAPEVSDGVFRFGHGAEDFQFCLFEAGFSEEVDAEDEGEDIGGPVGECVGEAGGF